MADVAVPVLPDLPEGLHWLLTQRSAGHYGFTGDTKDLLPGPDAPAADRIAAADALILPGTHFLASDGSVRVEIPEPLGTLARFRATGGALLQRANAGDWSVAPDWTEQFARRLFETRADDFVACLATGEWHDLSRDDDAPKCVYPLAAWHDTPSLLGGNDGASDRLPVTPDDHVCAVLTSGRADTGVVVSRLAGEERVDVTSTDTALTTFEELRRRLMGTNPWPQLIHDRELLEQAPATMDAATLALVPFHTEENDDFEEVAMLRTPLSLPQMQGNLSVWTRRNIIEGDLPLPDVLLLGDTETRSPDEVFAALAPAARRLHELVEDDPYEVTGLCIGVAPEQGAGYDYEGPAFFNTVGGTVAIDDPDYGSSTMVACDGVNVLAGMYGRLGPHELFGEWVRGKN